MALNLQMLALKKSFDFYPEELLRLVDSYALPSSIANEANWWAVKAAWKEKQVVMHTDLGLENRGVAFLSLQKLLSAASNGQLRTWDLRSSKKTLLDLSESVSFLTSSQNAIGYFTPEGKFILCSKEQPAVSLFEKQLKENPHRAQFVHPSVLIYVSRAALSILDTRAGLSLPVARLRDKKVSSMTYLDGFRCFLSENTHKIDLVDLRSPIVQPYIEDAVDRFGEVVASCGKIYASSYLTDQTIKVWDVKESKWLGVMSLRCGQASTIAIDEKKGRLAVGASDGHLQIWDIGKRYPETIKMLSPKIGYAVTHCVMQDGVFASVNRVGHTALGIV